MCVGGGGALRTIRSKSTGDFTCKVGMNLRTPPNSSLLGSSARPRQQRGGNAGIELYNKVHEKKNILYIDIYFVSGSVTWLLRTLEQGSPRLPLSYDGHSRDCTYTKTTKEAEGRSQTTKETKINMKQNIEKEKKM